MTSRLPNRFIGKRSRQCVATWQNNIVIAKFDFQFWSKRSFLNERSVMPLILLKRKCIHLTIATAIACRYDQKARQVACVPASNKIYCTIKFNDCGIWGRCFDMSVHKQVDCDSFINLALKYLDYVTLRSTLKLYCYQNAF